jgi:glycosyltransferase involved in cell wall biosynthesis
LVGSIKNILHFNKIKKFIEINKLKKNIKILKFVSLKKLIQLYDYSEGLIYASSSGPENLPPLEAFARGKNVIISNYSGSREQLNNFANYFNLKKKSSIEEKILNFKKFKSKDLKSYARLKSTDSYIKNLIKKVERDFSV